MRTISSYLPSVKFLLWAGLMASIASLVIALTSQPPLEIAVKPASKTTAYQQVIASYPSGKISTMGSFEISHPTLLQRLMLPNSYSEFDVLRILFWMAMCICSLDIVYALGDGTGFTYSFSRLLRLMGWILVIYFFLDKLRFGLVRKIVSELTQQQFIATPFNRGSLELMLGILLIWLSRLHNQAVSIKQENDLTI